MGIFNWLRQHRPTVYLVALVWGMLSAAGLYLSAGQGWTGAIWILLGTLVLVYALVMGTK